MLYDTVYGKYLSTLPRKENIPTFLFVSRIVPMKGIEEVIKSLHSFIQLRKMFNYGSLEPGRIIISEN